MQINFFFSARRVLAFDEIIISFVLSGIDEYMHKQNTIFVCFKNAWHIHIPWFKANPA